MAKRNKALILTMAAALTIASNTTLVHAGGIGGDNAKPPINDDNKDEVTNPGGGTESPLIQSKKVVITGVETDVPFVEPGKEFTITYTIKNMTSAPLYAVSLHLDLKYSDGHGASFTPVGTTNEIYVGTLGANKEKEVSITLMPSTKLTTGAYNFDTSVMFNVKNSAQEVITKTSGIFVKQSPKVDIVDVQSMLEGDEIAISGTLINNSDSRFTNIEVLTELNGKEYKTTVNPIAGSSEDYFELRVPATTGLNKTTLVAKYEDNTGMVLDTDKDIELPKVDVISTEDELTGPIENEATESNSGGGFFGWLKRLFGFGN